MDLSVLIPTRGRVEKLGRCLERLARQSFPAERFEVHIGVDGDDAGAEVAHELARRTAGSLRATVHRFDHAGPGATRNRLFAHARGRVVLLLNDDVLPEPTLLAEHARAHGVEGKGLPPGTMVLGAAPWVVPSGAAGPDTLLDRLIRETSMVFFYDRMDAAIARGEAGPDHDWGFRHAWTLNLSLRREAWQAAGGFDERLRHACYEDLEFAYRVRASTGGAVRYEPRAVAHHDHRIGPEDYLRREAMMGRAAWEFAGACPQCAREVFGRDIRSADELAYARAFVSREAATVERLRESFFAWARIPAGSLQGEHAPALLRGLYEHHLPLKRWTWRSGLIEASGSA